MTIIVNSHYPLEYFGVAPIDQPVPADPFAYWASDEQLAPAADTLTFDFGTARPVNFLDFETSGKPLDLFISYWDGTQFLEVDFRTDIDSNTTIAYSQTTTNSWVYCKAYFETVNTQMIQLTFTRRSDPFPFADSDPFPFSVEVRNLRMVYIISDYNDFQPDEGFDVFGNPFRTEIVEMGPDAVGDGDSLTFWQSQPNPERDAVEALYFDVRPSDTEDSPVLIDEVYLEPLTPGVSMHIYTSNDSSEVDWDYKLWEPVPRHYVIQQGYHALPKPVTCRYVKLEFIRLSAVPYNVLSAPDAPPITYRKHPTWVQNEIGTIFPIDTETADRFSSPFDQINVDPLVLGFQRPTDQLHSDLAHVGVPPEAQLDQPSTDTQQLQDFVAVSNATDAAATDVETTRGQIDYQPATMFQDDLTDLLDLTRAQSRFIVESQTSEDIAQYLTETPLVDLDPPSEQSVPDLTEAAQEKLAPLTWFPRTCRHEYQIISSGRPAKIAYFVGLKTVTFTRRNYDASVTYDFPSYLELLVDDENVEYNEFVSDPTATWRYIQP